MTTPRKPPLTDFLGNEIHVGDIIVYPSARGSSAADVTLGEVLMIDKIRDTGKDGRAGFLESQRGKDPFRRGIYDIPAKWILKPDPDDPQFPRVRVPDWSKAYVLKVKKIPTGVAWGERSEAIVRIKNVDRVVIVTSVFNRAHFPEASDDGS